MDAVKVSTGASGAAGVHTAASRVFVVGVIVVFGATVVEPVDHALKVNRVREIPVVCATTTGVLGATN